MRTHHRQPICLTIAGSDSGGGAGIQADLKTFAALGVHGTSAVTCITAQNPAEVTGVQAVSQQMLRLQLRAVFQELPPLAVKTGMLFSEALIDTVVKAWPRARAPWLVVDPVMVSTSGASLLKPSAVRALTDRLFPHADVITPNLDEAAVLLGRPLRAFHDLERAAVELHLRYGTAVLLKGGHLKDGRLAQDVFFDGRNELVLSAPFIRGVSTHGTGCTYSAAIAGYLSLGLPLDQSVELAKHHITQAISQSIRAARHMALNPFWVEE